MKRKYIHKDSLRIKESNMAPHRAAKFGYYPYEEPGDEKPKVAPKPKKEQKEPEVKDEKPTKTRSKRTQTKRKLD